MYDRAEGGSSWDYIINILLHLRKKTLFFWVFFVPPVWRESVRPVVVRTLARQAHCSWADVWQRAAVYCSIIMCSILIFALLAVYYVRLLWRNSMSSCTSALLDAYFKETVSEVWQRAAVHCSRIMCSIIPCYLHVQLCTVTKYTASCMYVSPHCL